MTRNATLAVLDIGVLPLQSSQLGIVPRVTGASVLPKSLRPLINHTERTVQMAATALRAPPSLSRAIKAHTIPIEVKRGRRIA